MATLLNEFLGLIECIFAQNILVELLGGNDQDVIEPGAFWFCVLKLGGSILVSER